MTPEGQRRARRARAARLRVDPTLAPHGTTSTYGGWDCRCLPCTEANAERNARDYAGRVARLAADPTLVEHGRNATYVSWGCRCLPCTEAHAAYRKARKAR